MGGNEKINYWIFVHTGQEANKTFLEMIKVEKNWGFETTRPIRNRINVLQKGDVIVFYVGGKNGRYLAGEAKLTSGVHSPNRESVGGPKVGKLDSMVDFTDIDQWQGKIIDLTDRYNRERLNFIKNKDNWGMTFGQSIIAITDADYKDIKNLVNYVHPSNN